MILRPQRVRLHQLRRIEGGIPAALAHQLVVGAQFVDAAVIDVGDHVGAAHRG